ncbi:MAG: hypothetical protein V3V78_02420 [Candidatus Woesearchaeota archaeon]
MKAKLFSVLALILIGLCAISGIANADVVPVSIESVEIDGEEVSDGTVLGGIVRGDTLDIEVDVLAAEDDEIEIWVTVSSLDHDREKAVDSTDSFPVKAGKRYSKDLQIELPNRMNVKEYALRIEVKNDKDEDVEYNAVLDVEQAENDVIIKDVVFSPENQVKAGRALLTTVRVKNMGAEDEEVKVKVSVPELGISASDYIDEVEADDSVTSEELYLRVPECAQAGQYTAIVTVEFDEGDEEVSESFVVNVVEGDTCNLGADKTVIAVSTEAQTVAAGGSGAVYPLTISNTGSSAKTYTISANAGDWADVKISPNVAVLAAGETKPIYVYVAANEDASEGEQSFGVAIKSGDETLKEITLKANVEASSGWDKVKKGLEVALVVLVVLLVVIGLIVGFNRLKGDEDDEGAEETYY